MTPHNMLFVHRTPTQNYTLVGALCMSLLLLSGIAFPAQAQNSDPSQQQKATHYSLYFENFKQENYESAREDLLWILENAPGFPNEDERNYRRAYRLYEGLAEQASDDEERRAYLDTAATYLTTAVEQMEEQGLEYDEFKWEVRKGRFIENHSDDLQELPEELETPVAHYRRAFDLAPQELSPYYIRQVLESYLENNEPERALEFANAVEAERGDDEEVAQMVTSTREDIFSKNPQAHLSHLEEQLEQNPDSTQLMTQLFNAYVEQGNISKASELAPRLMETEPSAETVREIAEMRLDDGRPEEALEAYDRAVEQGADLQAEDYYNRGRALQQMDNFAQAREEFLQAIELQNDFGRAYIAIGDLYARTVSECGGGEMSRGDKAVYWVAVDKYEQAKEVDPSVASTADSKIQTYRQYFPTQEDIFYRSDWESGSSFTVDYGCYSWIGETTTVRQAPSS